MNDETRLQSIDKNCKNCGGNLVFFPQEQSLKCESCGSVYAIEKIKEVKKHDLYKKQDDQTKEYQQYVKDNKIFKCANCGSSVVLNVYEISKNCPYCGSSLVIDETILPGLKPDGVIPFMFDKIGAGEKFEQNIKKKWLAPRKFKKAPPSSQIKGLYIPSFSFDGKTQSSYNGRLYNEYTTTDSEGHTHTHRRYFHIAGNYDYNFTDLLVESSSKINQDELQGVLPYNFENVVGYQDSYIRGYSTEHYSQSLESCEDTYRQLARQAIRDAILRKHPHDGVDYLNVSTEFDDEYYAYDLVPLYKFDYEYKKKKYVTYMNGQTGAIDSHLPKSGWKIALIVFFILCVVALPIILSIISK